MSPRSLVFAAAALAAVVSCTAPTSSVPGASRAATTSSGGSFSVLSYNIDGLPSAIQSLSGDTTGNPELYTPVIGTKVSAFDIVNVQEDFNSHAALYAADTHAYRTATSGGAGVGSGLNTLSVFPFSDDIDRVTWNTRNSSDGNNLTPKGFTWLRLRVAEGVYLDVYNLHTCAGTSTSSLAARVDNLAQLVSYINTNSVGNAVLVFGDTNTRYTRTGDTVRSLLGALDGDPWVTLVRNGTPPALGTDALVWESTDVLTDLGYEFVDKIFYRGNAYISLVPTSYEVPDAAFRYTDGSMLADHRPIVTRFQYTLAPSLKLSDQFGGPHGTSYSDVNRLPSSPVVSTIGLRAGTRVDQVNLTLGNGTTFSHGGTGGTAKSLTLASGDYVKSLTLCSGVYNGNTRIFSAKFTTNTGATLSGGTSTSTTVTYTAPAGWQIVGFHGRSGDALDKVGVIYAPVP